MIMKAIGLSLVLCLICHIPICSSKTIQASSCSYEDVQQAIDLADTDDTVLIPAGNCTWTTELKLNKGISLMGAGINATTIINNVPTSTGTSGQSLIEISATDPWRLSGMTITDTGENYDYCGHIDIRAISDGWELDHVKFINSNYRHMFISRLAPGVIHNCIFQDSSNQAMNIRTASGHDQAASLWETETHIGGDDAIFIEDCLFNNTNSARTAFDSEWGAKVVFRFNTLVNSYWLNHGCENGRGAIWIEAYNNKITMTTSYPSPIQTRRGGTGVTFNNKVLLDGATHQWEEYVLNDYCAKGARLYYTSGSEAPQSGDILEGATSGETATVLFCDTPSSGSWDGGNAQGLVYVRPISGNFTFGETVNIQDKSSDVMTVRYQPGSSRTVVYNCCEWNINGEHCTEYPCLDQVGRTYNQLLAPLYNWNNTVDGIQLSSHVHGQLDGQGGKFTCDDAIQKNRDYYEGVDGIQTSSFTPFDGTEGVGWGTLENRPVTCTPNVAYWAIDAGDWNETGEDGVLYTCTAPNTWIKHYEPYPYPHPIRNDSPLSPPSNLHIVKSD